jgi:hypothetical protein
MFAGGSTSHGRVTLAVAAGTIVAAFFLPGVAMALSVGWAALTALVLAARMRAHVVAERARRGGAPTARDEAGEQPFVSIHLCCCDEPPGVVIRTLDALARLRWPAFEVIVFDNNTRDPSTWRPVAERCERLGERFAFFHVDHLEGAKAAALDRCLERTDPRAALILTVDADYRIDPDALEDLVATLRREDPTGERVSHVQAPQAYLGVAGSPGLERAYGSYFERYAVAASAEGAMLLTGTLSLIRVDALREVGGWTSASITEDAELGRRLLHAGWRGLYCPHPVGRGQMPDRLSELAKQRRRWVFGNAQVLFDAPWRLVRLGLGRASATFAQLTAWFHPWVLPALGLALFAGDDHRATRLVLAATTVTYLAVESALFLHTPHTLGRGPDDPRWRGLVAHFATSWQAAVAWLEVLFGVRLGFERTSKRRGVGRGRVALRLAFGLTAIALAFIYGAAGEPFVGAACLALAALPLASHLLAIALEEQGLRGPLSSPPLRTLESRLGGPELARPSTNERS